MLFKAILTGGVLSVLAGVGVYYGTEGADVLEADKSVSASEEARVEATELAGGADVAVGNVAVKEAEDIAVEAVKFETADVEAVETVEVQDPPKDSAKPKTKWLDQYLKKTKPSTESKGDVEVAAEVEVETEVDVKADASMDAPKAENKQVRRIRFRQGLDGKDTGAQVTGTYVVSKENRPDTQDLEAVDIDAIDLDALNLDGDVDVEALKNQLGLDGERNVEVRVIKKMHERKSRSHPRMQERAVIDYDLVLTEAKKLLVVDMKNQAVLEIVDYAVDNGDMAEAAGLLEDLSTPELRDTARARIGAGLARHGKTDAAFAVLEELEIDELAAPIRLEIITALMATRQERKAMMAHK